MPVNSGRKRVIRVGVFWTTSGYHAARMRHPTFGPSFTAAPLRLLASAGLAAACVLGLHVAGAAAGTTGHLVQPMAAAKKVKKPVITSLTVRSAAGIPLPSKGATVTITVHVQRARTCTFLAPQEVGTPMGEVAVRNCSSGKATVRTHAIANLGAPPVKLEFEVQVGGPGGTAHKVVMVKEKGEGSSTSPSSPGPPLTDLTLSAFEVPSAGGTVVATATSADATTCTLTATPALWPGANPLPVNCNSNTTITVPAATTVSREWTILLTASNAKGVSATSTGVLVQDAPATAEATPPPDGTLGYTSLNWAGYVLEGQSTFSEASGSWTVPVLNCASTPNAGAATWVGTGGVVRLDGSNSGPLLQTGISTDCVNGAEQAYGWWELVPSNPNHAEIFTGFPVSPGDSITASVTLGTNGQWETRVDDLTTGLSGVMVTGQGWGVLHDGASTFTTQGSTAGITYSGAYTAEWIEEDYSEGGSLTPLANFGTVTFSNLTTNLPAGWTMPQSATWYLVDDNGNPRAVPSPFTGGGFSVTYTG